MLARVIRAVVRADSEAGTAALNRIQHKIHNNSQVVHIIMWKNM